MDAWRLLSFRKAGAAENMAVDEAVFRSNIRGKSPPTLRFYGWRVPTLSLGYFQDFAKEVDGEACLRLGIETIRRPTGGRAVLHEEDLTYAVIVGDSPLFPPHILKTFRIVSRCIAAGLAEIGIRAEMKGEGRSAPDESLRSACFFSPSRYELLVGGRKICGAAQMRSHGSFLQHGSLLMAFDPVRTCDVMLPHRDKEGQMRRLRTAVTSVREEAASPVDEETLCRVLREGFEKTLGVRIKPGELSPDEETLKRELMEKKYAGESWTKEGRKTAWISGL